MCMREREYMQRKKNLYILILNMKPIISFPCTSLSPISFASVCKMLVILMADM